MGAIQYPLINGVRHSWSSCEFRLGGGIVLGITEVNYSAKSDAAYVRGAGSLPIAQTLGNFEFEADFSILAEEFNDFMQIVGPAAMTVFFDMVVSYDAGLGNVQGGTDLSVIVDTIQGCRITDMSNAVQASSADAVVRKLTLKPMMILWNGIAQTPEQPRATG